MNQSDENVGYAVSSMKVKWLAKLTKRPGVLTVEQLRFSFFSNMPNICHMHSISDVLNTWIVLPQSVCGQPVQKLQQIIHTFA